MKKKLFTLFFITLIITKIISSEKTIAVVKAFNGSIDIKNADQILELRQYLPLFENTEISLSNDATMTIFMYTGKKITLTGNLAIKITDCGISPIDNETKKSLAQIEDIYSKKDTLGSRSITKKEIPDEVTKKIEEIEKNILDPVMQALLKGECYKKYGLKQKASKEFRKHKKLLEALKEKK